MTYEEAKALIEAHDSEFLKDDTDGQQGRLGALMRGLAIIVRHLSPKDPYPCFACEHDILYVYDFRESITADEVLELHRLGFHLDSESGCWAKFA